MTALFEGVILAFAWKEEDEPLRPESVQPELCQDSEELPIEFKWAELPHFSYWVPFGARLGSKICIYIYIYTRGSTAVDFMILECCKTLEVSNCMISVTVWQTDGKARVGISLWGKSLFSLYLTAFWYLWLCNYTSAELDTQESKVASTYDGDRVLDASAHILSRALVSQSASKSWCIKYSVTLSVKQAPFLCISLSFCSTRLLSCPSR
jgi:hypothetical protein